MPVIAGRPLDYDETAALLDVPVLALADSGDPGDDRLAYLNFEHAARAGVAVELMTPQTIWTLLRGLGPGSGLRIDPESAEELVFAPEEVDAILGIDGSEGPALSGAPVPRDRASASVLSRRARAELVSSWVLYPRDEQGRPLPTSLDAQGGQLAFCWRDEEAARGSLGPGESVAQLPLEGLLRDNPELTVIIDPGLVSGVFVDATLRAELLAATEFFPRGYLAAIGELAAPLTALWVPTLEAMAAAVREQGIAITGLWAVGYRLERAPDQILLIADVDESVWPAVVAALGMTLAAHPVADTRTVSSLRLSQIPEAFHAIIRASRNAA